MSSIPTLDSTESATPCCATARRAGFVVSLAATIFATTTTALLAWTNSSSHSEPAAPQQAPADEEGWITISDGKTFEGWKINENPESWKIEDGAFVANGQRSHLFYVGEHQPLKNFELKVDVMTREGSNGGIYFHTKYQESGWPEQGYESQVNNSQGDPQKTGGLYNTVRVEKSPIPDDEWWTQHIIVKGNHVIVKLNDEVVVDYTEPEGKEGPVKLSEGTIAFQAHDPGSTVYFKNVRIKPLD